jgi:hypothetical protein
MKNQVKFLCITFLILFSLPLFSQTYQNYVELPQDPNTPPISNRVKYDAFDLNGNPIQRTQKIAVVYVDFLDGRNYQNGGGEFGNQPLSSQDLQNQPGINLDAVAEIGLTTQYSPYEVITPNNTSLYFNPAKYTWTDRYKMFFSTDGSYIDNAHPDYYTHNPIPQCFFRLKTDQFFA